MGAGTLDGDEFLLLEVVFPTHVPWQAFLFVGLQRVWNVLELNVWS